MRPIFHFDVSSFKSELNIKSEVTVYIDTENVVNIVNAIEKYPKKFRRILYEVLSNNYNDDLYAKEAISLKTKYITAMKFKGKDNLRIYCK